MKRILLVTPMPPGIGGISVSSQRLYDKLRRDGYDVDVYKLNIDNPVLNNKPCIALRFFFIPFNILFRKRYDIIHCHFNRPWRRLYLVMSQFLFKRAKLIFTLHGDIKETLKSRLNIVSLARADKIICVQMGDSQKAPLKFKHKCVDIPAFIFPNVISERNIPDNVLRFVKKDNIPLVIFNGAIDLSQKYYDLYGYEDTINIYKQLQRENIRCRLLMLINNKIIQKEHKIFVEKLKRKVLDDSLVLFVENGGFELIPLFKYAKIYLRPTKTDGDSLSVREALAMNCNVIASDKAKRPKGTIVYHTNEELYLKLKSALCSQEMRVKEYQNDFYENIVELYEML